MALRSRRRPFSTVLLCTTVLLPAACDEPGTAPESRQRPTTTAIAPEAERPSDLDVSARFPGLLIAVGNRIVDVSTGKAIEVARWEDVDADAPPVAVDGGFVFVTVAHQLMSWQPGEWGSELLAGPVSGFAVRADGKRVAWSVPSSDGTTSELVEADISGVVRHRTPVPSFARVVAYATDGVVALATGDGAEAAAATWVPATGAVTRLAGDAGVAGGRWFGSAVDAGEGSVLLTEGDGNCPAIADVRADGGVANVAVPRCPDDARRFGAVSRWLQRQYATVHGENVTITEFDRSHTWPLHDPVVDVAPVGPSHVVAVTQSATTPAVSRVRYCRHTAPACTDVALADDGRAVWIVRHSLATRGPAPATELTIVPATAPPGGRVRVSATNFCPFSRVVITMEPEPGLHDVPVVERAHADRAGTISSDVLIPARTAPGPYILNTVQEGTTSSDAFPCMHFNAGGKLTVARAA